MTGSPPSDTGGFIFVWKEPTRPGPVAVHYVGLFTGIDYVYLVFPVGRLGTGLRTGYFTTLYYLTMTKFQDSKPDHTMCRSLMTLSPDQVKIIVKIFFFVCTFRIIGLPVHLQIFYG